MTRVWVALGPMMVAGLAGLIFVRGQGDDGARFVASGRAIAPLSPLEVQRVVRTAPEPTAHGQGPPGRAARCRAGHSARFRNPWRCTIRYASGVTLTYRIFVLPDGSYQGDRGVKRNHGTSVPNVGVVRGCCINLY